MEGGGYGGRGYGGRDAEGTATLSAQLHLDSVYLNFKHTYITQLLQFSINRTKPLKCYHKLVGCVLCTVGTSLTTGKDKYSLITIVYTTCNL